MRVADVFRYARSTLFERKVRATLVILGILIGPLIVVSLISVIQGFDATMTNELLGFFSPLNIYLAPKGQGTLNPYVLNGISRLPGVKVVVPYYLIPAYIVTPKGLESTVIFSMDISYVKVVIPDLKLQSGTLPSEYSLYEIDVGYYIANPQYSGQPTFHTGQPMTVYIVYPNGQRQAETFIVVGQLDQIPSFGAANFNQALYASLPLGERICGTNYAGAIVVASSTSEVPTLANEIKEYYGSYVTVTTTQEILNLFEEEVSSFEALLVIAGIASFVVAFFTVMATMLTAVVERTREIGLLVSLGFTRGQIMAIFLAEASIMGIIGGGIGTVLGYFGSFVLASIAESSVSGIARVHIYPLITPIQLVEVFLAIVSVTTIAGIIPAYKASKIEPAKALRYEV